MLLKVPAVLAWYMREESFVVWWNIVHQLSTIVLTSAPSSGGLYEYRRP